MTRWIFFVPLISLCGASAAMRVTATELAEQEIGSHGSGNRGGVAAGGAEAVAIGLQILKSGGNAADSAAATLLALSVTDSTQFCFGGEVPILIYDAKRGVVEAICGLGVAPRLATREFFVQQPDNALAGTAPSATAPEGIPPLAASTHNATEAGGIPARGVQSAATPAALDACLTLLARYGTLRFEQVAVPTLDILDRRQAEWHARLATTLRRLIDAEQASPNDRLRGLRLVADYFYRGPIAKEISAWSEANGGLLRYSDLAVHVTRIEEPISIDYRGYTIYKCGPWTQGPYLLEALQLLQGFDLKSMGHNRAASIHTTIEAMKLALADRDVHYGDPCFVDVPMKELLSPEYASLRRSLIDADKASLVQRPGDPRAGRALLDESEARRGLAGPTRDTTTCVVADQAGNVVAATPSGWQGVEAGETGVWLGTRLQSFNLWEGHPNCIVPGKRPRITLTPTLVLKNGKPSLAVSVAGGDSQDQAALQLVLNHIDFGLDPVASLAAVRFGTNHHIGSFRQTSPQLGSLTISAEIGDEIMHNLTQKGHLIQHSGPVGTPVVLAIDPVSGRIDAAGDPRKGRHAAAY